MLCIANSSESNQVIKQPFVTDSFIHLLQKILVDFYLVSVVFVTLVYTP
jgi:hypothetical protein